MSHHNNVLSSFVVHIAVGEHGVEVLDALLSGPVIIVLKTFLDGPEVHGMFNDFVIVRYVEFLGVYRGLERPAELVFPDSLHDGVLQILELVGVPPWPLWRGHRVRLDHTVDWFHWAVLVRWR